jgi:hypothetical protein
MGVDYVMVPVPEELADKVLTYVSLKGAPPWGRATEAGGDAQPRSATDDTDSDERGPIARAFDRLDDAGRNLGAVVAVASLAHEEPIVPEVARRAGLSTREALGTILELNNVIQTEGGPPIALAVKGVEGVEDPGFTWDTRAVVMLEPVARSFAELAGIDIAQ